MEPAASPADLRPYTCPKCRDKRFYLLDVPYGHPDFGQLKPCDECRVVERERQQVADGASQLGERMRRWTFENYDLQVPGVRAGFLAVREFAEKIVEAEAMRGARPLTLEPALYTLWGMFGTGKTHLGAALVNYCTERGIRALFCDGPNLWPFLGATMDRNEEISFEARFAAVANVPVLVLDEPGGLVNAYGVAELTQGAAARRARLIDHRYRGGLPTLILDQRHPSEWGDPRLAERLLSWESVCINHETPESYRIRLPGDPWGRGEGENEA